MLLTTFGNIQYLGRQGLAFRKNSEEEHFDQLMKLSAKIDPRISKWLERKQNKHVHGDYQDEVIRITAFILPYDITKSINESRYCFIIK